MTEKITKSILRDLTRLAIERAHETVLGVVQLTDDPRHGFSITTDVASYFIDVAATLMQTHMKNAPQDNKICRGVVLAYLAHRAGFSPDDLRKIQVEEISDASISETEKPGPARRNARRR